MALTLLDAVLRVRANQYAGAGTWLNEATVGSVGDSSSISGATYDGAGDTKWDFDGNNDFIDWADDAELDFGAADSFTIGAGVSAADYTPAAQWAVISKRNINDTGWELSANINGPFMEIEDASAATDFNQESTGLPGNGADATLIMRRDVNADNLVIFVNGTPEAVPTADGTADTLANGIVLRLGARGGGANDYLGGVFSMCVIRGALTDGEIGAGADTLHDHLLNQTVPVAAMLGSPEGWGFVRMGFGWLATRPRLVRPEGLLVPERLIIPRTA